VNSSLPATFNRCFPTKPPVTPGFAIESVYLPATEVGGDFFQIMPANDGSLLVVVGDVSGKSLKAAMTVGGIIGALRGCPV
jgi:phosphoserine phosphatase RsbU/P